jgi:hypothetical protein
MQSRRNVIERLKDLFKLYRNETVEVNHKKYILPHFTEVEIRTTDENQPYIAARNYNKFWVCEVNEGYATESQMSGFVTRWQKTKRRVHQKILVVLDGVDENAILMAKAYNVWVWDVETLNVLMNVYGEVAVVR